MAKRLMPAARRSFARCTEGNRNAFGHGRNTTEAIADNLTFRSKFECKQGPTGSSPMAFLTHSPHRRFDRASRDQHFRCCTFRT
jgi:hypothetical protein